MKSKIDGGYLIYETVKILKHHFPDLHTKLSQLTDSRKQSQYSIEEIVFGGISLFLFKTGSRNNYNNFRTSGKFLKNFQKVFSLRLPSMDAVADVLKKMPETELEDIKRVMVKSLIERKIFYKMRFQGKYLIAIDATGIHTYHHKHCDDCLHTTSKKGKKTYYHKVLEAKLIAPNGFSISICTVFIDNKDTNDGLYTKQGCETKAFVKLAAKLKKAYPRLPICLCADGLYPKKTFFEACENNNWDYIVTLKEGNLKGFWKKIRLVNRDALKNEFKEGSSSYRQDLQWINNTQHNGTLHNWIQCEEVETLKNGGQKKNKFVHLSSFEIDHDNAILVSANGRLRWKIENEGFDIQKNHGYNVEHKYCRKSYLGTKNFYQCCQIAHIINQLIELSKDVKQTIQGKTTVKFMWEMMRGFLVFSYIKVREIREINEHRFQIKYPLPST